MLLALLLMASTASAADQPTYYPPKIQAFVNCMSETTVTLPYDARAPGIWAEARQCLDDTIAAAVEESAKAPDLRGAIKEMYLKSEAMLDAKVSRPSYTAFQEARRSVFLETKLAGLANEAALPKPGAQ